MKSFPDLKQFYYEYVGEWAIPCRFLTSACIPDFDYFLMKVAMFLPPPFIGELIDALVIFQSAYMKPLYRVHGMKIHGTVFILSGSENYRCLWPTFSFFGFLFDIYYQCSVGKLLESCLKICSKTLHQSSSIGYLMWRSRNFSTASVILLWQSSQCLSRPIVQTYWLIILWHFQ